MEDKLKKWKEQQFIAGVKKGDISLSTTSYRPTPSFSLQGKLQYDYAGGAMELPIFIGRTDLDKWLHALIDRQELEGTKVNLTLTVVNK